MDRAPKFPTPALEQLRALELGPSAISRALGPNARGKCISPSQVSRWLAGDSRPDENHRPIIKRLWKIDDTAWLTETERAELEARLASTCPAPTGTNG